MRIYFDMCSLQRPLDDQTQLRVLVETQAVLGVLALCESGAIELIASDALVFENEANPDVVRRDYAAQAIATDSSSKFDDSSLPLLRRSCVTQPRVARAARGADDKNSCTPTGFRHRDFSNDATLSG